MSDMKNDNFRPAAAMFDMDGLMLDTERPMICHWIEAGKLFGCNITTEMVNHTIGISAKDTWAFFQEQFGADFPLEKIQQELYRRFNEEFEKGIAHKPGLVPLLDHLSSLKIL